jgi:glycosyltransferase involved in cell wall biosynthesis
VVWNLHRLADAFVIANDVTNRCNPLYEAMCVGLPVISVRDPSTADLLQDGVNCLLVPPDEGPALGQAMMRMLIDSSLRAKLSAGGRQTADRSIWTWGERMRLEIEEVKNLLHCPTDVVRNSVGEDCTDKPMTIQGNGNRDVTHAWPQIGVKGREE